MAIGAILSVQPSPPLQPVPYVARASLLPPTSHLHRHQRPSNALTSSSAASLQHPLPPPHPHSTQYSYPNVSRLRPFVCHPWPHLRYLHPHPHPPIPHPPVTPLNQLQTLLPPSNYAYCLQINQPHPLFLHTPPPSSPPPRPLALEPLELSPQASPHRQRFPPFPPRVPPTCVSHTPSGRSLIPHPSRSPPAIHSLASFTFPFPDFTSPSTLLPRHHLRRSYMSSRWAVPYQRLVHRDTPEKSVP